MQLKNFENLLDRAKPHQIDPKTNDLFPWWEPDYEGNIVFNPNKFSTSHYYQSQGGTVKLSINPQKVHEKAWDLNNLRFFDKEKIANDCEKLIDRALQDTDTHKPIVVAIGTGGTISMKEKGGTLYPALTPKDLIKMAGREKDFIVGEFNFPTAIDSSQMEIDYVADIAIVMTYIFAKMMEKPGTFKRFAGFMVTHGTDTVAQSQCYLSFMQGECPFNVIYTVAQRPVERKDTDAIDNINGTLDLLKELQKKKYRNDQGIPHGGVGVQGIFAGGAHGKLYNGPTSVKQSDTDIDLLRDYSPDKEMAEKKWWGKYKVNLGFLNRRKKYIKEHGSSGWTPIIFRGSSLIERFKLDMGNDPECYAEYVRKSKAKAFVIDTFGSFTMNRKIVDAVMKAAWETGKLVFATNPFPQGSTNHQYADAQYLTSQGVIPLKMLQHAAYAKLMLAFEIYGEDDKWKIIKFMTENNFCGEQLYDDALNAIERKKTRKNTDWGISDIDYDERLLEMQETLTELSKNRAEIGQGIRLIRNLAEERTSVTPEESVLLEIDEKTWIKDYVKEASDLAVMKKTREAKETTFISREDRIRIIDMNEPECRRITLEIRASIRALFTKPIMDEAQKGSMTNNGLIHLQRAIEKIVEQWQNDEEKEENDVRRSTPNVRANLDKQTKNGKDQRQIESFRRRLKFGYYSKVYHDKEWELFQGIAPKDEEYRKVAEHCMLLRQKRSNIRRECLKDITIPRIGMPDIDLIKVT